MHERWAVLAALTFARTVMGFQFETVPALAAPVMQTFGLRYFELGTIVGLYLLPGIAVALPGGVIVSALVFAWQHAKQIRVTASSASASAAWRSAAPPWR